MLERTRKVYTDAAPRDSSAAAGRVRALDFCAELAMLDRSCTSAAFLILLRPGGRVDRRVAWAVKRMESALESEISVAELAREVNLSPSRFTHLFHAETGRSPRGYLQSLRMERAGELLGTTVLPIRDVMLRVGVNDPSHFARNFRRHHGSSPREFRSRTRAAALE